MSTTECLEENIGRQAENIWTLTKKMAPSERKKNKTISDVVCYQEENMHSSQYSSKTTQWNSAVDYEVSFYHQIVLSV